MSLPEPISILLNVYYTFRVAILLISHLKLEPWINIENMTIKYVIATSDPGKLGIDSANATEIAPRIPPQQRSVISVQLNGYLLRLYKTSTALGNSILPKRAINTIIIPIAPIKNVV